jgi:hypothetical protein
MLRLDRDLGLRMAALFPDFRYALRQSGKSRGFTSTALMTIALGIGAVTAVFSVVNSVLLQPFAFRDPGQIVVWRESIREIEHVAPILFWDWAAVCRSGCR